MVDFFYQSLIVYFGVEASLCVRLVSLFMKRLFFVAVVFLIVPFACLFATDEIVSPLAGTWYTSKKEFLNLQIDKYLNDAKSQKLDNVIALILPHAGYAYSGQTAAYGIKELSGKKYSRVVIFGPSHHVYMPNKFSVPEVKRYRTLLGTVEVDTGFTAQLKKFSEYSEQSYAVHYNEHSIQIEIPLLQSTLVNFKIVPVLFGNLDSETIQNLAKEIKPLLDDNTLVIISSDFTHYGSNYGYMPFPVDINVESNLRRLDMNAVNYILEKDFCRLDKFYKETKDTICGICGIELLMLLLPEGSNSYLLNYSTSGKTTGDYSNSVSYATVAFTGKWESRESERIKRDGGKAESAVLSEEDKNELLNLARKTIRYYLDNGKIPSFDGIGIKVTAPMKEKRGVFVTLTRKGELRGCVGEIFPTRQLYLAVSEQAINSAFMDSRFSPVTKDEFSSLDFEISVLTVAEKVKSWKDIVIGRDGIILKKDGCSAVFLPQVATEQGWNLEETLSHLSMKAGLPFNAWKEGAEFMVFQANVFH